MENIAKIAPILGSYCDVGKFVQSRAPQNTLRSFGNRAKPRYVNQMSADVLQWTTQMRDGALVLCPKGRVDETSADDFKNHLVEAISSTSNLAIIDLSGIAYMSSRGLRGLTLAQRAATQSGSTIVLASPNDTMREILAISRYDMVFKVTDTIEEAIAN